MDDEGNDILGCIILEGECLKRLMKLSLERAEVFYLCLGKRRVYGKD